MPPVEMKPHLHEVVGVVRARLAADMSNAWLEGAHGGAAHVSLVKRDVSYLGRFRRP